MKFEPYVKEYDDMDLKKEFENALNIGSVFISDKILFNKNLLSVKYIKFSDIIWAYLRKADSSSTVCCGRATFSTYSLRFLVSDKKLISITFERSEDVKKILKVLEERNTETKIGYSEELATLYNVKS